MIRSKKSFYSIFLRSLKRGLEKLLSDLLCSGLQGKTKKQTKKWRAFSINVIFPRKQSPFEVGLSFRSSHVSSQIRKVQSRTKTLSSILVR